MPPAVADVGAAVHDEITHFSFDGVPYRRQQEFYLAVARDDLDLLRIEAGRVHQPALVPELWQTDELYYPLDLVEVLKGLGIPAC